jgi:hypothetical protein
MAEPSPTRDSIGCGNLLHAINHNHLKRHLFDLVEFQAKLLLERQENAGLPEPSLVASSPASLVAVPTTRSTIESLQGEWSLAYRKMRVLPHIKEMPFRSKLASGGDIFMRAQLRRGNAETDLAALCRRRGTILSLIRAIERYERTTPRAVRSRSGCRCGISPQDATNAE